MTLEQLMTENQQILIRLATLGDEYYTAEKFWEDSHKSIDKDFKK